MHSSLRLIASRYLHRFADAVARIALGSVPTRALRRDDGSIRGDSEGGDEIVRYVPEVIRVF